MAESYERPVDFFNQIGRGIHVLTIALYFSVIVVRDQKLGSPRDAGDSCE